MKRSEMREQAFLLTFEGLFSSGKDIDDKTSSDITSSPIELFDIISIIKPP